jgi:hypothetical protein
VQAGARVFIYAGAAGGVVMGLTNATWLLSQVVAACTTHGCRLPHTRRVLLPPTVAASITYGCSIHHLRLQHPSPTAAASLSFHFICGRRATRRV